VLNLSFSGAAGLEDATQQILHGNDSTHRSIEGIFDSR
jgi:hypothetical protein